MIDLDELQKLAEAATPGEWTIEKDYHRCYLLVDEDCEHKKSSLTERTVYRKSEGDIEDAVLHVHESYEAHRISPDVAGNFDYEEGGIIKTADAEFIAAANPQVILELIERLRQVGAERDAALARITELEEALRETNRLMGDSNDALIQKLRTAEARIAQAAELHRKRKHWETDREDVFVCDDCTRINRYGIAQWPCPTAVSLGLNEGENDG